MFELEIELIAGEQLNFDKLYSHFSVAEKMHAKSYFKRAISIWS